MNSHQSQVPEPARDYFAQHSVSAHPVISQVYWDTAAEHGAAPFGGHQAGWHQHPWANPKRVSHAALRKLRTAGASAVVLSAGGHDADFTIRQLLSQARHPLLGGALLGSRTWKAR